MARETFAVPLLNGGIRNDLMNQLISPTEAWDALNEDSTRVEGASSKRKGTTLVSTISPYPIRCIFEGEIWDRTRIVVAGGQIFKFTPPSTFEEIYSDFDGDAKDIVHVAPYRDEALGRVLVFFDGINHPMYWDGINPMQYLPNDAPLAKCGLWHKTYFIFGNLLEGDRLVYDSGDLTIASYLFNEYCYSEAKEIDLGSPGGGQVLRVIVETTETNYTIYIFDREPTLLPKFDVQGSSTPTYSYCNLVGTTSEVYNSGSVSTFQILVPEDNFYTTSGKLYLVMKSSGANGTRTATIRVLTKTAKGSSAYGADIKWCDDKNINEWAINSITNAGRLPIETTGGGDIIAMLPMDLDTFVIYKDDGSIISCYTTGSGDVIFGYKTISEGFRLISGDAIVRAEGYHWALSDNGFIKVGANAAELIEPYGKAKELFKYLTDDWKYAVATYDPSSRRILVSYPRTGGTTNDGILIFNLKYETYDVWDRSATAINYLTDASAITISDLAGTYVRDYSRYTVDDARLKRTAAQIFFGNSTGSLYKFTASSSDSASAISAYRESGFIRPDPKFDGMCWFRSISLEIDLLGDYDITLEYRSDYDVDWKSIPVINTSKGSTDKQTKVIKRYINTTGRAIKVKWSNATAYNDYIIRSMYIEYEKMEEQDA